MHLVLILTTAIVAFAAETRQAIVENGASEIAKYHLGTYDTVSDNCKGDLNIDVYPYTNEFEGVKAVNGSTVCIDVLRYTGNLTGFEDILAGPYSERMQSSQRAETRWLRSFSFSVSLETRFFNATKSRVASYRKKQEYRRQNSNLKQNGLLNFVPSHQLWSKDNMKVLKTTGSWGSLCQIFVDWETKFVIFRTEQFNYSWKPSWAGGNYEKFNWYRLSEEEVEPGINEVYYATRNTQSGILDRIDRVIVIANATSSDVMASGRLYWSGYK